MTSSHEVAWFDLSNATPEQMEAQTRFMQRSSALMFTVAAVLLASAAIVPKPDMSDRPWDLGLAAALLAWGIAVPFVRRPPVWLFQAGTLYSITICSILIAVARPIGASPFFYIWPVAACAYAFPRRTLYLAIAWMTITLGIALGFFAAGQQIKLIMFFSTVGCVGLIGIMTGVLRERGLALLHELERASTTDPLTGLLNRRAFNTAFEREFDRATRAGMPLSVIVFDLDHFKALNDELGHAGGDAALCDFASALQDAYRGSDVVARIGGEEFATVLFNTDAQDAQRLAEAVGGRLRSDATGGGVRLSVSAGVATLGPGAATPDDLLLLADKALYAAKDGGRDRVARWDGRVVLGAPGHGADAVAAA